MRQLGVHVCPHCGAPIEPARGASGPLPAAVRCAYCGSPVATLRCFDCHHANFAESSHCIACGRDLGLEPLYEAGRLGCPRCKELMSRYRGHPGELHDCASCAGQFVDHELMRQLLDRRQVLGACSLSRTRRNALALGAVEYIRCPECREVMNRKNFAGSSGVVVDVCHAHGLWFDGGELPLVLGFVESGGLARARAELRQRPTGPRLAHAAPGSVGAAPRAAPDQEPSFPEAAAEALVGFWEWLSRR